LSLVQKQSAVRISVIRLPSRKANGGLVAGSNNIIIPTCEFWLHHWYKMVLRQDICFGEVSLQPLVENPQQCKRGRAYNRNRDDFASSCQRSRTEPRVCVAVLHRPFADVQFDDDIAMIRCRHHTRHLAATGRWCCSDPAGVRGARLTLMLGFLRSPGRTNSQFSVIPN